jgi:hypothetical protein
MSLKIIYGVVIPAHLSKGMDATVVMTPFPMEFFASLRSGPHIYSYELVDINSMILQ